MANRQARRARPRQMFDRDEQIGFRCPRDFKRRLEELGRRRTRDVSSLAIEFIREGMERMERMEQPVGAVGGVQ